MTLPVPGPATLVPRMKGHLVSTTDRVSTQVSAQDLVPTPAAWAPMASAPSGQAAICIDIWDGAEQCRRTDCFWHEGAWCHEVFDNHGHYRVLRVADPTHWMPTPEAPTEG